MDFSMSKKKMVFAYFFSILIMFSGNLFADGCFFQAKEEQVGNSAESPNQRALIIFDKNKETMVVQVKYQGEANKFSWILPLPSIPEENSIVTVSDSIFSYLHNETQPKLYIYSRKDNAMGTFGERDSENAESYYDTDVIIWENLQVGPYEIAVISSPTSQALIDWLATNDYDFPDSAKNIVDFYTQKNWYFVAVRVNVSKQLTKNNSTYQAGLPAIKLTFKTEKPVFPLRISELTSAEQNEIEIYVVTKHRMICESYHTAAMKPDEVQPVLEKNYYEKNYKPKGISCACDHIFAPESNTGMEYEELFQKEIESFAKPSFIVEYASPLDFIIFDKNNNVNPLHYRDKFFNDSFSEDENFWITRMRTILSPDKMQKDVNLIEDPDGDNYLSLKFWIEEKQPNPWSYSIYVTPGFLFVPVFISKRIRKKYSKHLLLSVFLLILATT
jgi:hypothetical protein